MQKAKLLGQASDVNKRNCSDEFGEEDEKEKSYDSRKN